LKLIERALKRNPRNLKERVWPYLLLVALSRGPDISLVRRAAQIDAPHFKWFNYIASVLVDAYRSTSNIDFKPGRAFVEPPVSPVSSTATTRISSFR
jgi:hypothetical protein